MTYQEILKVALQQSATDCSCAAEDFLRDTNVIVESKASDGCSRYMDVPHICALFSYGSNVVAACRRDLIPEVTAWIGSIPKHYRCFETPAIYDLNRILEKADAQVAWMHTCFLADPADLLSANVSCPYETRILHPEDFADL